MKGSKALLLVDEVSDKELAEKDDDESIDERELALEIWRLVLIYKARGEVLKAIDLDKTNQKNRFDMLIEDLEKRYVVECRDKLERDADMISARAEYLHKKINSA